MSHNEYLIAGRSYTYCGSIQQELMFPSETIFCTPSYLGMLTIKGEKSRDLLQGQLSCDLNKVSTTHSLTGAYCSLKGRVICLTEVIQLNQTDFALIMPHDLLNSCQKILNRYALLSRVKLSQQHDYQLIGCYGTLSKEISDAIQTCPNAHSLSLEEKLNLLLLPQDFPQGIRTTKGDLFWHYLNLLHKRISIYPETQAHYLPHRLDLHQRGILDFDKGCYLGQEIIARTHYRAKLKHGLFLYQITLPIQPSPGQVLTDGKLTLGEIVDSCPIGKNQHLIAATMLKEHPMKVFLNEKPVLLKPFN